MHIISNNFRRGERDLLFRIHDWMRWFNGEDLGILYFRRTKNGCETVSAPEELTGLSFGSRERGLRFFNLWKVKNNWKWILRKCCSTLFIEHRQRTIGEDFEERALPIYSNCTRLPILFFSKLVNLGQLLKTK